MLLEEIELLAFDLGIERYRASQIFSWLYKGVYEFDQMPNLPAQLRKKLDELAFIDRITLADKQISKIDGTKKYLFKLKDGNSIESVFLKYNHGNTVCISSQAGCRMNCSFCASALSGFSSNLSAGEMVEQVMAVMEETGESINNIVVMGTGEPFDNYDNLCRFLSLVHAKEGLNIGFRSITVSTCGIIPKIHDFGKDFPTVNLAVSLHAPNDEIRNVIMPINRKYPMDELLKACREHTRTTGRRITFEYALIKDVNDKDSDAYELARKLKSMLCHVNLIPLNTVRERGYRGAESRRTAEFKGILNRSGINATIRRNLGSDIDGACGQLRLQHN
jgi:23S rRNA (adenine2503-C2)-methyltransferase